MANSPRVKRMIMFKHGVAYLERSGPAENSFELSFKRAEMNDLLKSLAVWVARGDARIGAIAFEAPQDPEQALAERKLLFEQGAALRGLLHSLRGRMVTIDDGQRQYQGEVIGFEETPGGEQAPRYRLMLRNADATVLLVDLATARSLELKEEASRADLQFIIDRARAATSGENRTVSISLSGRAEDLRISYVIPSPIWRVSYRLTNDDNGALLMAWGIVHNPTEEDLDNIDLTLTTGQPVSFTIDLYYPKHVERAVVEEQTRAAAPPIQYERAHLARTMKSLAPVDAPMPPGFATTGAYPMASAPPQFGQADSFIATAQGAADTGERGEFFEYRVTTPISLKRGGSAMVPLAAVKVDAHKERIWREGQGKSPDIVLSFKNDTDIVLEEGPVVIYDESAYAGEAMVPYSARGVEVKLAFAKDLAVRCNRSSTSRTIVSGLSIGRDAIVEEQRHEEHHTFYAVNDHGQNVEVIFELPKRLSRSIDPDQTKPFEETESYWRFRAVVPARQKVELKVIEQWAGAWHYEFQYISMTQLQSWLENRFLSKLAYEALAEVLSIWEEARRLEEQRNQIDQDQQAAYAKQAKISQQLAVLKEHGPEGDLRLRYVKELEAEQDKINSCEAEMRKLQLAIEQAQKNAREKLVELIGS